MVDLKRSTYNPVLHISSSPGLNPLFSGCLANWILSGRKIPILLVCWYCSPRLLLCWWTQRTSQILLCFVAGWPLKSHVIPARFQVNSGYQSLPSEVFATFARVTASSRSDFANSGLCTPQLSSFCTNLRFQYA